MTIAKFEFSLFGINTYALVDPATKDCAIIDPGMICDEERQAISHFIESNGLHLTHIINTHLHIDHAIGNSWLLDHFGAPILAHPADLPLGQRIKEQARMFGIPQEVDEVNIDHPLHDGNTIRIGEGEVKVIHLPGHSPGGIALYDEKDGFIIVGDTLLAGSVGRTDLPGGSMPEILESIRTRLLTLPDDTVVYPGHGPATTISRERRSNPFLR